MALLAIAYGVVVALVAGWRGVRAILGLVGGIGFMILFMVPALLEGGNPVLIGLTGSTAIMFAALYFAHGLNAKTSTALLGTLFGLGVICGAIWAESAWGRFWGWDPKETVSFIAWIIYAAYLHARATAGWRNTNAAWINIAGFVAMLFNLFIINLVVSGLHSYAGL